MESQQQNKQTAICVYCSKTSAEASFAKREHVIPELMGVFKNNLTIHDLVCDDCNSNVFNPLETKFKEDTEEGIFFQMHNLNDSAQIRVAGDKVKMLFNSGLGDEFFDGIFPFFQFHEGEWKVFLPTHIRVKLIAGRYSILLLEKLKRISQSKLKKIRGSLHRVTSKDLSIYSQGKSAYDTSTMDDAIQFIRDKLGIDYKQDKIKYAGYKEGDTPRFEIKITGTIDNDVGRIIAKIAFNYFIYCAKEIDRQDLLLHPYFDKIKSYILGSIDPPIKEIIVDVQVDPIVKDEQESGGRFLAHVITFHQESGFVVSRVNFLGKRIYTIILGQVPEALLRDDFGCGHMFDPFCHKIYSLTQNEAKRGTRDLLKFGLFQRI